jgi:hypothetical protein
MRVPYDAVSIVLALDVYARAARIASLRWQHRHSVASPEEAAPS